MQLHARTPIPSQAEIIELSRAVRRWLDWDGGSPPDRVRQRGLRARNRMVSGNMRLVGSLASKLRGRLSGVDGLDVLDLLQEGAIGLTRAAEKYDHRKGYQFSTYSYWWIRQAMNRAISHYRGVVRVAGHTQLLLSRLGRFMDDYHRGHGRWPTNSEICAGLDIHPRQIGNAVAGLTAQHVLSLDATLSTGKADNPSSLGEILPATGYDSPDHFLAMQATTECLNEMLTRLPARHQAALTLSTDGFSAGEIGEVLGADAAEIRRLVREAKRRLTRMWQAAAEEE